MTMTRKNRFSTALNVLDPLWNKISLVFLVICITYWINFVPKFWAGGFTTTSAISVICTSLSAWMLTQNPLEKIQSLQGWLEENLRKCKIPTCLLKETSVAIFFIALIATINFDRSTPELSKCYYHWGVQLSPPIEKGYGTEWDESKKFTSSNLWCRSVKFFDANNLSTSDQASDNKNRLEAIKEYIWGEALKASPAKSEIFLQRAIAFDSDNADAHFMLGWRKESISDFEEAKKYYRLSMQNGSGIAATRLVITYLTENKPASEPFLSNLEYTLNRYGEGHFPKCLPPSPKLAVDSKDITACRNQRLFFVIRSALNFKQAKISLSNGAESNQEKYSSAIDEFHRAYYMHKMYLRLLPEETSQKQTDYLSCLQAKLAPYVSDAQKREKFYQSDQHSIKEFYWDVDLEALCKKCNERISSNSKNDLLILNTI
jgi:tetratricopeptide (TPR) repeat protein